MGSRGMRGTTRPFAKCTAHELIPSIALVLYIILASINAFVDWVIPHIWEFGVCIRTQAVHELNKVESGKMLKVLAEHLLDSRKSHFHESFDEMRI